MSGHPDPQVLALWVGGDLEVDAASRVGLHLDACAECRETVEEIERSKAILQSSFPEPLEVDLESVRRGVARTLAGRRRTVRWGWSLGSAAAALVLVFAGLTNRKPRVPIAPELVVQLPPFPIRIHLALEIPDEKRTIGSRHQRAHAGGEAGLRAVNFVPRADGSTELLLITADRNVVILLPPTERTIEQ